MTADEARQIGETRPGEKGPPAWRVRHTRGAPMSDEPPDSSSEVAQEEGLVHDEDGEDDASRQD